MEILIFPVMPQLVWSPNKSSSLNLLPINAMALPFCNAPCHTVARPHQRVHIVPVWECWGRMLYGMSRYLGSVCVEAAI